MTRQQILDALEDLYAILNDPKRTDEQARVSARLRIRTYIAQVHPDRP